jgi:hypothetical protein
MQQLPIPDDWTEADGYILLLACFPNSVLWRSIARGQIHNLTRGRTWDAQTGNIKAVQAIGWQIYDSVMTCKLDDLVTAVETLNVTIQTNQEQLEAIVTALNNIQAAIQASGTNVDELEDDLANVWGVLQSISGVLGGDIPSPPNPL